jgi:hypothetical protein
MNDLPERINVIRTISYDVPKIVGDLQKMNMEDIDLDVVMEYIQEWVYEDMSSPPSRHDIVYQDENGEEVW